MVIIIIWMQNSTADNEHAQYTFRRHAVVDTNEIWSWITHQFRPMCVITDKRTKSFYYATTEILLESYFSL